MKGSTDIVFDLLNFVVLVVFSAVGLVIGIGIMVPGVLAASFFSKKIRMGDADLQ